MNDDRLLLAAHILPYLSESSQTLESDLSNRRSLTRTQYFNISTKNDGACFALSTDTFWIQINDKFVIEGVLKVYWGLVHPVTLADSCYHYQHFQIPKRTSIDQNEDNDKENSENQSVNGSTTNGKPGRKVSDKINRNSQFSSKDSFFLHCFCSILRNLRKNFLPRQLFHVDYFSIVRKGYTGGYLIQLNEVATCETGAYLFQIVLLELQRKLKFIMVLGM